MQHHSKEYRKHIRRVFAKNKDENRIWKIDSKEEQKVLADFLRLCSSKLTSNEMHNFDQEDIKRVVKEIIAEKVEEKTLRALNAEELHDYIVGQKRLF